MTEISPMPTSALLGPSDSSLTFDDTPFLTIDPTCIDSTPLFPDPTPSLNRQHNLPNINVTPRRRSSLVLHHTPPNFTSEPSSAASTFAYSNASGMLTPYTSSSSVCSSRRPSFAHLDSPHRYLSATSNLNHHLASPRHLDACGQFDLSRATPSPRYAKTLVDSLPPSPQYTDQTALLDDRFRRDSLSSTDHTFLHDLALPDTPVSLPRSAIDTPLSSTVDIPLPSVEYTYPNDPLAFYPTPLQPAPDFVESNCSTPQTANWPTDQFDFASQTSSPTAWEPLPAKLLHARTRDDCRISKTVRRKPTTRVLDAGSYEIQDRTQHRKPTKPQTVFACPHPGCEQRFGRPEHCNRHQATHDPVGKEVMCPLCDKGIKQRRDNLKAHIIRTHFTPAEKKKTEKMNARHTMKDIYERLRDPSRLSAKEQELWLDIFKKPSNEDLYGIRSPDSHQSTTVPRMSPHEIWPRVREMDARFTRLLSDRMTIHDREKVKGDREGLESGKLTKFWRMLGWTIAETQNIRAIDVAADWDGPAETTLWDLDPRRKAMLNGTLTVEEAEESLGVDMTATQQMGLEQYDPRWTALHAGEMALEDAEKNGVGPLHAAWALRGQRRSRY